jgi:hypothetical protein
LLPTPDISFTIQDSVRTSHEFFGSLAFGIPVGAILLAILFGFRKWVVSKLPETQRKIYEPLCRRPIGPLWIVTLSLILGIWSHVIWRLLRPRRLIDG